MTEQHQDTLLKPETQLAEPGDHDRFAHIVFPASKLTEAYVLGIAVTALCGHTWVPSRDPNKYPVCPTCKDIYNHLHQDDTRNWDGGT
jgi:hypothetical protein